MAAASPASPPSSWPVSRWARLAGGVGLGVVLAILYWHRPAGQFFYPRCSFHALSGLWCPGCGGLRSVHELLHGHFLEAIRCNALFVVGLPVGLGWWFWRRRLGRPAVVSSRMIWGLFALVAVFTVLRNLPGIPFAWLAP